MQGPCHHQPSSSSRERSLWSLAEGRPWSSLPVWISDICGSHRVMLAVFCFKWKMALSRAQDAWSPEALCRFSSGPSCDSAELAAFEQAPTWVSGSHNGEITPIKVSKSCWLKLAKGLGLATRAGSQARARTLIHVVHIDKPNTARS